MALIVAGGVFVITRRSAEDPHLTCTARQLGDTAYEAVDGPTFDALSVEVVGAFRGALSADTKPGTSTIYVATQQGEVMLLGDEPPFKVLDLSAEVAMTFEQGLLGVAVSPDGQYLYLDYTDLENHTHVVEFALDGAGVPLEDSRREVLFVEQPFHTHNGGGLEFTSDGLLWIGLGDGGGSLAGPGFGFGDNAQDLGVLLGSILRIDPRPTSGSSYGIPLDNPYVGEAGKRPEIWVSGLRNPWRFSIDETTGDLWIGDVGQACWEEINYLPASRGAGAGQNLGWNIVEGVDKYEGGDPDGTIWPAYLLSHSGTDCSIVGGVVYRGRALPELSGWYLFTDSCNGELRALREESPGTLTVRSLGITLPQPVAFAVDEEGEVLTLSLIEGLGRLVAATAP